MEINWLDKFTDIITALIGTGLGWFFANKIFYRLKKGKFKPEINIVYSKYDGMIKYMKLELEIKNESHIDCYNVKISVYSKYFNTLITTFKLIEKYENKNFEFKDFNSTSSQSKEEMTEVELIEIEYVTQYGVKKKITLSNVKVMCKDVGKKYEID
nr:hypothetical protein [uncultured Sphingobacterium sp.]